MKLTDLKEGLKMQKVSIVEINACSNQEAQKKLRFNKGDGDARVILLIEEIIKKQAYNIISLRELTYSALIKLERLLAMHGFKRYIHKDWDNVDSKNRGRYSCLSVLFVHNSVDSFEQIYSGDKFETTLRYVAGKFKVGGQPVIYKSSHVPCVEDSHPNIASQLRRKENMLRDELEFQLENIDNCVICAGDYNCDSVGTYHCKDLFNQLPYKDAVEEPTYGENQKLDHVFLSPDIVEGKSDMKVQVRVLPEYYMDYTDHRIISVDIYNDVEDI